MRKQITGNEEIKLYSWMAQEGLKGNALVVYANYTDPAIAKAQEQKVPTRGEMIQMINEAILNNPNKKQLYIPDFSLSAEYIELKNELDKAVEANNLELVQELNKRMLYVKISGTVTNEEIQAEIDKTLIMPLITQRN